jgi:hypothetical protein
VRAVATVTASMIQSLPSIRPSLEATHRSSNTGPVYAQESSGKEATLGLVQVYVRTKEKDMSIKEDDGGRI